MGVKGSSPVAIPTSEGSIPLGTEIWNSADAYTKLKIVRLLYQLDIDEEIAEFGKRSDDENVDDSKINERKIRYFNFFLFHLEQLIGNCEFIIKKYQNKKMIEYLKERLKLIRKVKDGIYKVNPNFLTKQYDIVINTEHFEKCFNVLRDVKNTLNIPIDDAGLIFRHGQALDLDELMKEIETGSI